MLVTPETSILVEPSSFQAVKPYWKALWPGRKSAIEPTSGMQLNGGFDKNYIKFKAYFWEAKSPMGSTAGVLSGHLSSEREFRTRGLYIAPEYRRQGVAHWLLKEAELKALSLGAELMWALPRKTSLTTYENFGFIKVSDWLDHFEFSPNCYVVKKIIR